MGDCVITIHLPEDLERSIRGEVLSGRFESIDDAMAEAARLLLRTHQPAHDEATHPATAPGSPAESQKPIWEVVDELRKSVPPEEFAKLPKDGAEQLDHYLYGSPKRPTT
jgi:Arc/MetJ-type ribon-helix-helix transcriptional regulator